jgi:hypothetical protein
MLVDNDTMRGVGVVHTTRALAQQQRALAQQQPRRFGCVVWWWGTALPKITLANKCFPLSILRVWAVSASRVFVSAGLLVV